MPRQIMKITVKPNRINFILSSILPMTVISRVGAAFMFAIETAMRASEICNLRRDEVYLERRFLHVAGGKTPAARRDVPLSSGAIAIIKLMDQVKSGDYVFNLKPSQIDAMFRRTAEDLAGKLQ